MIIHMDDPFPGRCKNLRPHGLEMLRCLDYEHALHRCTFPEPKYPQERSDSYAHHIASHPLKPQPWRKPEMSQESAPWTEAQVQSLVAWQESDYVHSFTCPNRSDVLHGWQYGDIGGLKPTTDGWVCLDCDYTQHWAHDFMLDWVD